MDSEEARRYGIAKRIVHEYYKSYLSRVTDEIIERKETFENPFTGGVEDMVERHNLHLCAIGNVYNFLERTERQLSEPEAPRQTYRIKKIPCKIREIEEMVNDWLARNPGTRPISVSIVPAGKGACEAMLLYAGAAPGDDAPPDVEAEPEGEAGEDTTDEDVEDGQ